MRLPRLAPASCSVLLLGCLVPALPATAAPRPITGKLSAGGYTVFALAASGKARSVRAGRGTFRFRPPAQVSTLHLRAADGVYAGPVVVGGRGRRVVMGVRAGARLGTITVADGYARATRLRRGWREPGRWARARAGVPIGARSFGRVRSRPPRRGVSGDRDVDGIPDRVDIDDDGDRILDKVDRPRRARASQRPGHQDPFDLASALGAIPLQDTVNVNAGSSDAQIDAALPNFGWLAMSAPDGASAELDCGGVPNPMGPPPLIGGLPYCSYGGTGRVSGRVGSQSVFPECCDPDGDGHGTLQDTAIGPDFVAFHLDHRATSAQIGTGDTLILRVTKDGQETQLTDTQQFIFATTPALASYVDELGRRTTIAYPVEYGSPGTAESGLPVADGPDADSDVEITVTLWRPQRRPTSEGECVQPPAPQCAEREWIDVGGLDYAAGSVRGQVKTSDSGWCAQGSFSSTDPNLVPGFGDPQGGGFRDHAPAQPANPANTLTYRLNLTSCLARYGLSLERGRPESFTFEAFTPVSDGTAGVDNASTVVSFALE